MNVPIPAQGQLKSEPTAEEIAVAAKTLSQLRPGLLPLPIFLETTRLTVSSILEIVPLRKVGDSIQVLLTKRDDDDPNWPGMLHTPGTVVRPTDEEGSYGSAFGRILDGELASVDLAGDPQYVDSVLHKVKRGMEDAKIFFVEVSGEPGTGTFYDVQMLPENVVDTQIDFIRLAAKKFAETTVVSKTKTNFGNDLPDEYSKPVNVRETGLAKVLTLKERAETEKPGRTVSIVWDERLPLIGDFRNRYSYVVRFTQRNGKAGNHYHKLKQEMYYALHGEFTIILEDVATKEREELHLKAGDNQCIYVPATVAHVVVSRTDDDALLVIASHPDTSTDILPYRII